jgi:hypothetical protein
VNQLLDYQFFNENKGEVIGETGRRIRERWRCHGLHPVGARKSGRTTKSTRSPSPPAKIPRAISPAPREHLPEALYKKKDADGWSWEVMEDAKTWFDVEFYTVGKKIEMDAQKMASSSMPRGRW